MDTLPITDVSNGADISSSIRVVPSEVISSAPKRKMVPDSSDEPSPNRLKAQKTTDLGFVDIKKLEHSARLIQKNIKLIIDEAPTVKHLNDLIHQKDDLEALTYDSLKNNKLVHLAAQLKSLYLGGKLHIFDEILDNNILYDEIDKVDTKSDLETESPTPVVTSVDEDDVDECPELPPIRDPHLYARVFIHKSTINNKSYLYRSELISSHNERLEFLGDSVLNNIATLILYERYPSAPEGELSKMRSILVNNITLAEFSISYGFDKKLKSNINDAILRQGKQKIFADIFEAYVGALSMENNLESGVIKNWLHKLFLSKLKKFDEEINGVEEVNKDAKLELYSLVGTAAFHPTYKVLRTGDGATKPFQVDCVMGDDVLGTGIAPGLKEAGLRAAMVALKNKVLLEKYIQLRLNTDKAQSIVSQKPYSEPTPLTKEELTQCELPLVADDKVDFDTDARNKLYAIVSRDYNMVPEYRCLEIANQQFSAELKINSISFSHATDNSKKRAMAKAAKVVLDNPAALNILRG